MERHITVPVAKEEIQDLRAGDYVYLTGVIYTARDAAHKRMDEVLSEGKELPLDIKNQMILLYGTISGERRKTDRLSRTDNSKQDGQICTTPSGSGAWRNDRKREKKSGCPGCNREK